MRNLVQVRAIVATALLVLPRLATSQEQPSPPRAQELPAAQPAAPVAVPAPPPPPPAAVPPTPAAATPPANAPPAPVPAAKAQAQPPTPVRAAPESVAYVFEIGGDHGLHELYALRFSDGSHMSVGANTGLFIQGGATFWPLSGGRFRTQLLAGFKWTGQEASNADIDYYAFPVELTETVDFAPIRLGAGAYGLLLPKLNGTGFAAPLTSSMKNTVGFILRAEYRWSNVGLGVRYLWNRLRGDFGGTITAPAWGIVFSAGGATPVR